MPLPYLFNSSWSLTVNDGVASGWYRTATLDPLGRQGALVSGNLQMCAGLGWYPTSYSAGRWFRTPLGDPMGEAPGWDDCGVNPGGTGICLADGELVEFFGKPVADYNPGGMSMHSAYRAAVVSAFLLGGYMLKMPDPDPPLVPTWQVRAFRGNGPEGINAPLWHYSDGAWHYWGTAPVEWNHDTMPTLDDWAIWPVWVKEFVNGQWVTKQPLEIDWPASGGLGWVSMYQEVWPFQFMGGEGWLRDNVPFGGGAGGSARPIGQVTWAAWGFPPSNLYPDGTPLPGSSWAYYPAYQEPLNGHAVYWSGFYLNALVPGDAYAAFYLYYLDSGPFSGRWAMHSMPGEANAPDWVSTFADETNGVMTFEAGPANSKGAGFEPTLIADTWEAWDPERGVYQLPVNGAQTPGPVIYDLLYNSTAKEYQGWIPGPGGGGYYRDPVNAGLNFWSQPWEYPQYRLDAHGFLSPPLFRWAGDTEEDNLGTCTDVTGIEWTAWLESGTIYVNRTDSAAVPLLAPVAVDVSCAYNSPDVTTHDSRKLTLKARANATQKPHAWESLDYGKTWTYKGLADGR
jgi:hypothetical protein